MARTVDPSEVSTSLMDSARARPPPSGSGWSGTTTTLCVTMTALLAALCVWVSLTGDSGQLVRTDAGGRIGGHFSQTGAKAIDIVCSAVLAPLIVTGLNYVWFTSARRHTVNDIHTNHRGVPLQSLVAVSTSDSGSYNVLAMKTMIGGRTWRLGLLALLILVTALAKTALSNIIAYEAYTEVHQSQNRVPLRQLADPYINNSVTRSVYEGNDGGPQVTSAQRARMIGDIARLLTDIKHQGSDSNLESDGTYVGTNLTKAAMRNTPNHITSLYDVPAYKIAVECYTDQSVQNLSFTQMGAYKTAINLFTRNGMFTALYPGQLSELKTGLNDYYAFAAFTLNASDVFLGWTSSFNRSQKVIPSPYGDIRPIAMNASSIGFSGTQIVMSHWGIFCSLSRQEGLLNFTRGAPGGDNGDWALNGSAFHGPKNKVPSFIRPWQLWYRTPGVDLPGVGTALLKGASNITKYSEIESYTDYRLLAHNYLYGSAEIERIMYEVATTREDDQLGPDKGQYFHETSCSVLDEYYRITYVPALLLLGMVALLLATAIAAGMAVFGFRSERSRAVHQVNPLRLLVDFASALHRVEGAAIAEDVKSIQDIACLPDKELEAWAERYRITYHRSEIDDKVQLELVRVG